jgi:hypothetical protein
VVEEEALGFLRNYWGDRTVLQRVFDPRGYDFYQARELSYAIDFLDAQWIRLVLARGWLWFIPPSALAASLAVVLAWGVFLPRAMPDLDRVTAWCLLLVYLSNFAVLSTMGLLYRSAKPLVALLLVVLLFALQGTPPAPGRPEERPTWVYALCSMSLLDGRDSSRRMPHRGPHGLWAHAPGAPRHRRRRGNARGCSTTTFSALDHHSVNGWPPEVSCAPGASPTLDPGSRPSGSCATGRPSSWEAFPCGSSWEPGPRPYCQLHPESIVS